MANFVLHLKQMATLGGGFSMWTANLGLSTGLTVPASYKHILNQPKNHVRSIRKFGRLSPAQVTNEGKEMVVKKLVEEHGLEDEDYIIVDPKNPVPNPELGPLERRVSVTFEEGLALEEIDQQAMDYWFTKPAQGWATEKRRLKKCVGLPVEEDENFRHSEEGENRKQLRTLNPGDVVLGKVVGHLLHHGIRVDIGAEADGLIPVKGVEIWKRLQKKNLVPNIGDSIEVSVHAIRDDAVFRFPLQLAPTDEKVVSSILPPEAHQPPLDLRNVPLSRYDEIAKMSGRDWGAQKVLVTPIGPADMEDRYAGEEEEELTISDEDLELFDSIVADLGI